MKAKATQPFDHQARYVEGDPMLREREKRRIKHGKSSQSSKRLSSSFDLLRSIGSNSGLLPKDEVKGLIELISSVHLEDSNPGIVYDPKWRRGEAIRVLIPSVETISVKRGGAAYQVPIPIHSQRSLSLAIRWLIQGSKERRRKDKGGPFVHARLVEALYVLRDESIRSSSGFKAGETHSGASVDRKSHSLPKKLAMHRVAKSNRVFAHRRWR